MTATADAAPQRSQPVLPAADVAVIGKTMFDKSQLTMRLQDTTHFDQRAVNIRNAAQRPSAYNRINAVVLERNVLS
jgi:hypothetical protein